MEKNKVDLEDLTSGNLLQKMIIYSIPLVLTGLLQTTYNAADMIVVGAFASSDAMGAVGSCGSLIGLLVNSFMGLSVGSAVHVAKDIGARRYGEVKKTVNSSLIFSFFLGLMLAVIGFFLAEPLLTLMGSTNEHLPEAVPYMKAYFVGVPAGIMYNFLASILRSTGDTKRPLIFLTISGLVNVLCNCVLVIGFGLSAVGVGIATATSQYVALFLIFNHMRRLEGAAKIDFKHLKLDTKKLKSIVSIGLPAGLQSSMFSLSNVLIQSTVNSFGTVIVNGNSSAANIESFIFIAMNSMHHTALTFTGQHVGAGKKERIKPILFYSVGIVTVIGIVLGAIALIFARPILGVYAHGDAATIEAGLVRMSIICSTYFLCGIMDVGCGMVRGLGRSFTPMVISLLGSCALRIVWIYTVCKMFPGDIRVLYISYPVSWIITAAAHFISFIIYNKKLKKE